MSVDAEQVIATIENVIKLASGAIQLGLDAKPFAEAIYNRVVDKKTITQADLDVLAAQSDLLSAELQAPLPPDGTIPES